MILVLALLITVTMPTVNAAEPTPTVKKYHLDMGFQQAWYLDSKWEGDSVNTFEPRKEVTITSTIDLGKEIKAAKLLTVEQANFPFYLDDTHSLNYTDYLKGKGSYNDNYGDFVSKRITPVSAVPNGTKVTITYKALLDSRVHFDLADKLKFRDNENYVYGLLGGKSVVEKYQPEIFKRFESAFNNGLPEDAKAYLYFTPTVIEYEEEAPVIPEVPQVTPPADTAGDCNSTIKWSEKQAHTYYHSPGCVKTTTGRYCPGHICNHVYTYQTTLSTTATLKAVKPNGGATTFKSGYGFTVAVNNSISTKQISNGGACKQDLSKANEKKPVPPTGAEVRTSWNVVNKQKKYTQPKTVALAKTGGTATTSTFGCAANPVSNYNYKQIYTDVALKGTKQKPVKHTVNMYTLGGGVNGVKFCKNIPLSFTINGDMYEDDFTVDGKGR